MPILWHDPCSLLPNHFFSLNQRMSTGWLSVGKSFKAAPQKPEEILSDSGRNQETESDTVQYDGKRKSVSEEDVHDRKKHKKDKEEKHKKYKDSQHSQKSKKGKKNKKDHKDKQSTALVRSSGAIPTPSVLEIADFSSCSDGDFSSSDDETRQFNSTRSIIKQNRAEIMSGNSELTFLPNGEVVLLPSFARNDDSSASWRIDSRGDRNSILYAGTQPSEHLYTVYPGAAYFTDLFKVPSLNARRSKPTQPITSAQQYRNATTRPSGIIVSAMQQLKEYDLASKTDKIFLHRTQLLSERKRETKLSHKYRYFSPAARSVVTDVTLNRLSLHKSARQNGSAGDSMSNVSVMLPFSYVDQNVLTELGFATPGPDAMANHVLNVVPASGPSTSSEASVYTTAADRAQTQCNNLTRDTNQSLRQKPHELHTILHAVSAQDTICTHQLVASGRSVDAIPNVRTNSKTQLALQKTITERKVAILEQSIEINHDIEPLIGVLYELLVYISIQAKNTDAFNITLSRALSDCPANVSLRMIQHTNNMGVFNSSSCSALLDSINRIYSGVSQAALNTLAAQQLNTILHSSLYNNPASISTLSLPQQYQQLLVEQQLVQLQCDALVYKVQIERSAGNTEKAIAMLQAVLDFNLSSLSPSGKEYCTYWDSECTRVGESYHHVLPSSYMCHMDNNSSDTSPSSTVINSKAGYDAWVKAGRPAEPLPDSLFGTQLHGDVTTNSGGGAPRYLCDHLRSIANILNQAGPDTPFATGTVIVSCVSGCTTFSNTHARDPLAAVSTAVGEFNVDIDIDQNAVAAEYFLQQMLVSDITPLDEEDVQNNDPVDPILPISSDAAANIYAYRSIHNVIKLEPEAEDDMVYSRLHGYKIKIHKEQTGAIYKKILTDMGSNAASEAASDDVNITSFGASNTVEITANKLKQMNNTVGTQPVLTLSATSSVSSVQYKNNIYAKYTQYRPLRAAALVDTAMVEEQPERVIFGSDIESVLFKAEFSTRSSIIDVAMRQKLKQSLVVRILQALGVVFSHNTCSHSLFSRSCALNRQDINSVLNVDEAVLYDNIIQGFMHTPGSEKRAPSSGDPMPHGRTGCCYVTHLLAVGTAALPICSVHAHIVKKHLLCAKLGLDSELNFIIRIIADILRLDTNVTNMEGNQSNPNMLLSAEFAAHLRCVLVRLLTIRCQAELSGQGAGVATNGASATASTSASTSPTNLSRDSILSLWRSQCRGLLETSIAASGDLINPAVGNLGLWAEYLQCETMVGQTGEARKLADKVLKSLQPATISIISPAKYTDAARYTYTTILLALQPTTTSTNHSLNHSNLVLKHQLECTPISVHNALALLTQYVHNINKFNPILGKYNSELKPSKSSANKGGKSLSQEGIVGAMETLQNSILVEIEKLREEISRQRRGRVPLNLQIEDSSQIEYSSMLYYLVLLMAWLQFLSTLYASVSAVSSSISSPFPMGAVDDAVQQGDAVFSAVFVTLRDLLASPDATTTGKDQHRDATERGVRGHPYTNFFGQFVSPDSHSGIATDSTTLPELQYQNIVSMTSEAEVSALLLLERLHCTRLHFLLQVSSSGRTNKALQLSLANRNVLLKAVQSALRNFPLNNYIQCVYTISSISQPAGVTHMRAYYKNISQSRKCWGGTVQPSEILNMLCVEIFQANKVLLLDPLTPTAVRCDNEYAVFNTESAYYCDGLSDTVSAVSQALALCRHWCHDSVQNIRTFLETILSTHATAAQMPILWMFYIYLETSRRRYSEAKRLFFRAVSVCGWSQNLYMLCWGPLQESFTESERSSLQVMMEQRGLHPLRSPATCDSGV